MDQTVGIGKYMVSHTDIVRVCVILSLSLSCILITALSLQRQIGFVYTQLFYFPIIYATYFYPRKGIYLAGTCALAFELLSYFYVYPSTVDLISTTVQAVLFILVAVVVSYFTETVNASEARYRSIFESTLMGIILFDQNTFSLRLTNECAEQMLGYTKEELRALRFSDLFSTPEEQRVFFEQLGSSRDISNFQTRFLTKSREPLWVALSWRRVSNNMVSTSIIDINSRKLAEKAAEENLARYRQVTERSPTGIVIIQDDRITYVNPAFIRFSGYPAAELIGKDLNCFVRESDRDELSRFLSGPGEKEGLPEIFECRFTAEDGQERLGALFLNRITQQGKPALLVSLLDITEREQLKERIQKDTEMRHGMLSTVAHELRTPLQPIMGYLNLLMQDPQTYGVTEETRAILDRCARSVDRESQIINQMLELSVLDAGKIPILFSEVNVSELVSSLLETGGYAAKADLTVIIPTDATLLADEAKLSVVIDSMLSNAVNYSKPPRKIRIAYQFSSLEGMHKISIQDNGVGITNSQLDEIFEPFTPQENGGTPRKTRTGLSLSIAKKYVQMHGGFISVDSIVNLGSTFTIHIPRNPAPKETSHGT